MGSEPHLPVRAQKGNSAQFRVREDLCQSSGVPLLSHGCYMEPGFEAWRLGSDPTMTSRPPSEATHRGPQDC